MNLKNYIKDVEDFPIKGIVYRDIQPLLEKEYVFNDSVRRMAGLVEYEKVDYWVGIESRGFIFASALSISPGNGLKLIRKEGKLPPINLVTLNYKLEYGEDTIQMMKGKGKVVIVDDIYATGGTMKAAIELCKMAGYEVLDTLCLVDIGIEKNHKTKCLISY